MERNTPQHGVDHDQDESHVHPGRELHFPLNQSVSDSLTRDPANTLTPTAYLNWNTSAAMASVLECMTETEYITYPAIRWERSTAKRLSPRRREWYCFCYRRHRTRIYQGGIGQT